jgi:RNA polymerase sigma-70 factor (ECF subfamily)
MLRVKQGDEEAFAELVEEFQDRVVGILYHMLGNADEAEDLAQEVFLRVYRSRASYEPTAKFSTWLFTIVNNLARNAVRDRKRRRDRQGVGKPASSSQEATIDRLAVAPSGAMPSRIFAKGELAEIVREAVAQLSPDQRLAMMLHRFEHMNYQQIAEVTGKTEAAIKSLLARARVVLRDILEPFVQAESKRPTSRPED